MWNCFFSTPVGEDSGTSLGSVLNWMAAEIFIAGFKLSALQLVSFFTTYLSDMFIMWKFWCWHVTVTKCEFICHINMMGFNQTCCPCHFQWTDAEKPAICFWSVKNCSFGNSCIFVSIIFSQAASAPVMVPILFFCLVSFFRVSF